MTIRLLPPNEIRPFYLAEQPETGAFGIGGSDDEAKDAMMEHKKYDPVIETGIADKGDDNGN